jgi:hypothetical protein
VSAPCGKTSTTTSSNPTDTFLQKLAEVIENLKTENKPTEVLQNLYLYPIALNPTWFKEVSKPDNFVMIWALITAGQFFPTLQHRSYFPVWQMKR